VDRYELAWAAGFFDGEGWSGLAKEDDRRTGQPQARVNQAGVDAVPEVLIRLRSALGGLGRIGGPYKRPDRVDLYRWHVSSRRDVSRLLDLLSPYLGQVKLDQITSTLGLETAAAQAISTSEEWAAWAAGLYDGEGSTYLLDHRSHANYRIAEARVTQTSPSGPPEVLTRFAQIVGLGHINGPYGDDDAHRPVYRWTTCVFTEIDLMLDRIWPWLGTVKRRQASVVRDVIRSQPTLPRGRPDWGNRKTHCVNGHEYATSRLRPFVPRGGGLPPRDSHQCLVCAREQARARRDEKRRSAADDDRRSLSEFATTYLLK
jgi:hypothetical protein